MLEGTEGTEVLSQVGSRTQKSMNSLVVQGVN